MADQPMETDSPELVQGDAPGRDTAASTPTVPVLTATANAAPSAEASVATETTPTTTPTTAPTTAPQPVPSVTDTAASKASTRYSPFITRRRLLVAGGGLLVVGGAGLAIAELKYGKQIKKLVAGKYSPTPVPRLIPHPQKLPDGPMSTPNDIVIFDGALAAGWADRSWGSHTVGDSSVTYHGKPVITMGVSNWSGISLHTDPFDTSGYAYLQCYATADTKGSQLVTTWMDAGASIWLGGTLL
ncbi:MAG TPA: hypothetical protein VJN88_05805, partial [Ktedonobacterales bacterium]|nr:hypothetical protein [Ktedonobacterales bacterium]